MMRPWLRYFPLFIVEWLAWRQCERFVMRISPTETRETIIPLTGVMFVREHKK